MNKAPEILKVDPDIAIPGGEVAIDCADFDTSDPTRCAVWFGKKRASLVALSSRRALAIVPEMKHTGAVTVTLESHEGRSAEASIIVGHRLAEDLHPVTNPAFDADDGALFVTRSGSRGEQLPVTLFRIDVNGEITEFSGDITNPTGIAFDSRGQMFVSSRMDGSIYRITPFKEAVPFAHGLGVATGIHSIPMTRCTSATAPGQFTRSTALAKRRSGCNSAIRLGLPFGGWTRQSLICNWTNGSEFRLSHARRA